MIVTGVQALFLGALVILPGAALVLTVGRPSRLRLPHLLLSLSLSLAAVVTAALLLLWLGVMQWWTLALVLLAPSIIALAVMAARRRPLPRPAGGGDLLAYVAVLLVFGAFVALSPQWNFQTPTGMDAGNYEVYANHFATTGSLYAEVPQSVPEGWLVYDNTWHLDDPDDDIAQPNYMYTHPALLGVVREVFGGAPDTAWVVPALLGALNLGLLFELGRRLGGSRPAMTAAVLTLGLSPLYFYYSKQPMSEPLALLGLLMLVSAVVRGTEYKTSEERDTGSAAVTSMVGFAGGALLVATKLDAMTPVVLLSAMGVLVVGCRWVRGQPTHFDSAVAHSVAAGTLFGAIATVLLVPSEYIEKSQLGYLVPSLPIPPSLAGITLYLPLIALAAGAWFAIGLLVQRPRPQARAAAASRFDRAALFGAAVAWAAFVLWNLLLRPVGAEFGDAPDAFNLRRLFRLASPGLLVVAASGCILLLAARRRPIVRAMGAGLLVSFGWLLYKAGHTPPDVWWMRRYLVVYSVLAILAVVAADTALRRWRLGGAGLAVILLVGAVPALPSTWALLEYRQNELAPARLNALEEVIPSEPLLIVVHAGDDVHRALGIVLDSRRVGDTFVTVPPEDLSRAVQSVGDGQVYVVTPIPLEELPETPGGLSLVAESDYARQWRNTLDAIREDPTGNAKTRQFWVYART